ncbi:D-xylulose reductase A [Purpureocillium lavendulum]|uniref:D-xylulose reductase A n=1 Tax=Purpureocillium lavendulum TaxID=1247861 RepID=A0AB34FLC5_9HYPO|nr:D-xylulose reductase A [Purpureocillium lavendulum]
MYHFGVDAHCGPSSAGTSQCLQDAAPKPQPYDSVQFNEGRFCNSTLYSMERRATDGMASATNGEKRLGTSIGSASHRRRSSHAPTARHAESASLQNYLSIFEKIKRGGEKMFHLHDCLDNFTVDEPTISPSEPMQAQAPPRSRESLIRERTPEPPKPDLSGIYEAMTGSTIVTARRRHDTCSEDNRPHVCTNDMDSASRIAAPPA